MAFEDHHWQEGLLPEPCSYFGFVYEITHLPTGKRYIGRKQYWFRAAGGPKQADTDIRGKKWKKHHWKPSDWRTYTGSPTDPALKKLLKSRPQDFEFAIIQQCVSKRDLSFAEPAQMHRRGVGVLRNDEGELVYLNRHIPECYGATSEWYMKGILLSEEHKMRLREPRGPMSQERKEAMRKPTDEPCPKCGAFEWRTEAKKRGSPARYCKGCKRVQALKSYHKKKTKDPEAVLAEKRGREAKRKAKDPEAYLAAARERSRQYRVAKKLTKTGIEWEPEMSPLDEFIAKREKNKC